MKKIFMILTILIIVFMSGCIGQSKCVPIIKTKIVNVTNSCECKNNTIIKIQKKIVYKESDYSKYYADVYYKIAVKELDGYYDDIQNANYDNCTKKIIRSQDYLLNSMGYYQNSNQSFKIKVTGLEQFSIVLTKILNYCQNKTLNQTNISFDGIRDDYKSNYNKYIRYMNYTNETAIILR